MELLVTLLAFLAAVGLTIGLGMLIMRMLGPIIRRVDEHAAVEVASSTNPDSTSPDSARVQVSIAGIYIALVGAGLMLVGVFLPWVESSTFTNIKGNTVIQSGFGIAWVIGAVMVSIAAYDAHRQNRQSWSILILGVMGIALAVYSGTGDRLALESLMASPVTGEPQGLEGSPGVGIYATGIGSALAAAGGWLIAGFGPRDASDPSTQTCPECKFDVPADATICGHCRHRFS